MNDENTEPDENTARPSVTISGAAQKALSDMLRRWSGRPKAVVKFVGGDLRNDGRLVVS